MTLETTTIDATLAERGKRYGVFSTHAAISMALKEVVNGYQAIDGENDRERFDRSQRYNAMPLPHKEALDMIMHKIARILNGDPNYADSWHDIAGYAKLVEDWINERG